MISDFDSTTDFFREHAEQYHARRDLSSFLPDDMGDIADPQQAIPRIARSPDLTSRIDWAVQHVPTLHRMCRNDARLIGAFKPGSIHLVLTSPPYWTLKQYRDSDGQLGHVADYDAFLRELDRVWSGCYSALVPGGRLVCVVGDVCLSRRKNGGRHTVVPLHASIQEHCRQIGYDNLAPIVWHKISNANFEVSGGGGFLGKPFEPNSVIKNDIEFILMERKPGGYRTPTLAERILSVIAVENHASWFRQIWSDVPGESTRHHPAPYPLELAERLVRMFSFAGDTVLDPFMGTATTNVAAAKWGRNSIGVEIDTSYFELAQKRFCRDISGLFSEATLRVYDRGSIAV